MYEEGTALAQASCQIHLNSFVCEPKKNGNHNSTTATSSTHASKRRRQLDRQTSAWRPKSLYDNRIIEIQMPSSSAQRHGSERVAGI